MIANLDVKVKSSIPCLISMKISNLEIELQNSQPWLISKIV